MYLLYECKAFSFKYTSGKINLWKSTGLNNYGRDSDVDALSVATTSLPPLIDNGRMSVRLEGAYFKHTRLLRPNNDNVVNIYIVYLIDPISNSRNTDYTVQNALFGVLKITKMLQILQNINMKDREYVLMKVVHLVKEELTMVETFQFLEYMKIL